jgi:surface carbohydrate biosynthesis protein
MTGRTTTPSRKILLIVPYKARDLEGLALVAYHLERRYGHQVVFSNGYGIEQKLLENGPDAVVFDHLVWDFKARQARLAKQLGMKVLMLPTEGFHQDKEEPAQRAGKLFQVSHMVDCHFAWGDFARGAVLEQNLTTEDRIHTVGCPRFDFYSEPYLGLMEPRAEFLARLGIRNPKAPVVLWATSTTYVSRNQDKILHRQVAQGNLSEAEIRAMLEDGNEQFREHSRTVVELARRHPEWNVIIKVHPAEWINPYVKLVKSLPNLYLAFNAPIGEFLFNCDVLLQRGCTTATEAWMLGKPVLELEVGKYQMPIRREITSGNDIARTLDEADAAIQSYLRGAPISRDKQEARNAVLFDYYYRIDGKSSERCAALIHETISPPGYTDEDQRRTGEAVRAACAEWRAEQDRRAPNRLKDMIGVSRKVSLRFWKRFLRDEAKDNFGVFTPEVEITRPMAEELYAKFDRALRGRDRVSPLRAGAGTSGGEALSASEGVS